MRKPESLFVTVLVTLSLALSACGTQTIRDTEKLAENQNRMASKAVADAANSAKKAAADVNSISETKEGIWVGGHVVREVRHVELPPALVKTVSVNDKFMTLTELSDRLASIIDIPVRLAPEVSPYPVSAKSASGGMGGAPGMGVPGGGVAAGPLPGGMPGGMGAPGMGSMQPVHIDYGGPASGLLDVVASRFGTHWTYTGDSILFYNLETRTFELDAIPGDSALAASVMGGGQSGSSGGASGGSGGAPSGGGAGGAAGGGMGAGGAAGGSTSSGDASGSQTSVTSTLSVWNDIKSAVNSMLSSSGKAVVTPATGTIMVTDDPVYVARIAKYIEQENEILSKQVLLEVKVLSISRTDADQYGINWNAVFNSLSKNVGITATNAFPAGPGVGSLAMNILPTAGGTNLRQFAGSGAIINALSTQGKVSLVTSSTIVTLNNQPVPIQVGTQTSYLAMISNMVTANVGSTSSLTPGVVQTGFNMNLLPHLLDGRRLMLQFSVNISSLKALNTVSSGGSTIQVPEVDSRDFLQRVSMRSGETLLLSGFEQTAANLNKQGIGSADNTALGGGVSASKTRDIVVIMITPVIAQKAVHDL